MAGLSRGRLLLGWVCAASLVCVYLESQHASISGGILGWLAEPANREPAASSSAANSAVATHTTEDKRWKSEDLSVKREEVLGCFTSAGTKRRYMNFKGNVSSNSQCLQWCTSSHDQYLYSHYMGSSCWCADSITVYGSVPESECEGSQTAVLVMRRANFTSFLTTKYLASRGCHCAHPTCYKILCQNAECWVGPKAEDLQLYTKEKSTGRKCPNNTYKITGRNATLPWTSYTYCVPKDKLFGFWPLSECKGFYARAYLKPKNSPRLYQIASKEVRVHTMPRADRIKVHLVAYYRSGSTFTSELLRNHPEAFYLFEPLWSFASSTTGHAMSKVFNCDFYGLPITAVNHFSQGDRLKGVCNKLKVSLVDCLSLVTSRCHHNRILAAKTIRINMKEVAEKVIKSHPDLKVILLLRDPRGVINSRMSTIGSKRRTQQADRTVLASQAQKLCEQMLDDYLVMKDLMGKLLGQVTFVHYEDISRNKTAAAYYIYRSIGLGEPPVAVLESLNLLSDSKSGKNTAGNRRTYGTFRLDSLSTAYHWKADMNYSNVKIIDKACLRAYNVLGYQPVNSPEELADPNNYHRTPIEL